MSSDSIERLLVIAEQLLSRLERFSSTPLDERQAEFAGRMLTIKQFAKKSGISETTLRRSIRDGSLTAHVLGKGKKRPSYRIRPEDFEAYLAAGRTSEVTPLRVPTISVRKKSRHFD
jgi:excisionase family DNA binding protein